MGEATKMVLTEGKILFSKQNGAPFKLIRHKYSKTNEGIFGLEEVWSYWILENQKTKNQIELDDDRIQALLQEKDGC